MDSPNSVVELIAGVGIDSGGSLTKLVYFRPRNAPKLPDYVVFEEPGRTSCLHTIQPDPSLDVDCPPVGTLRFIKIPSYKNLDFLQFCKGFLPLWIPNF